MKSTMWKILIVVVLAVVVVIVLATKNRPTEPSTPAAAAVQPQAAAGKQPASPAESGASIPETAASTTAQPKSGMTKPPAALPDKSGQKPVQSAEPAPPPVPAAPPAPEKKLPRLLDLGAKKCVPCKMMAPLLEELATEFKGRLDVEFIDVWENPGAAEQYGIQSIPTQIFYDADGKEFFRHVGFYPKEDILARFKEKGITF
jgi:thioredoxin 1